MDSAIARPAYRISTNLLLAESVPDGCLMVPETTPYLVYGQPQMSARSLRKEFGHGCEVHQSTMIEGSHKLTSPIPLDLRAKTNSRCRDLRRKRLEVALRTSFRPWLSQETKLSTSARPGGRTVLGSWRMWHVFDPVPMVI